MKLAVFGQPVVNSKSPAIHARFANAAGLDVDYRAIDCPAGGLADALAAFRADGGAGCNLTVPLKAEGLELAASASDAAREAGASNTLVLRDSCWHADNTDGAGLIADFARLEIEPAGKRVLIVGAGGAVAGLLGPLISLTPERLSIANRSVEKAAALAERFRGRAPEIDAVPLEALSSSVPFDVIIQGTSLGHRGAAPALPSGIAASGAVAYDLNYGPAFQPFRAWCAGQGIDAHDGRGMLIEQAALAFECFTGVHPETAPLHALESL